MSEVIKLKVNDEFYDIKKQQLKMSMDVIYDFSQHDTGYIAQMRIAITQQIEHKIVNIVTDRYVEEYCDEIIKKVDLEAIIKRVQLATVNRVAR